MPGFLLLPVLSRRAFQNSPIADEKLHSSGDLRLKLAAHAIRHDQQGEIALMRDAIGFEAVYMAVNNMFSDNINQRGLSSSEQ